MDVDLDLHLERRLDDRVVVVLSVRPPCGCAARVEGAAVTLVDAGGEELCPRHLLPLAGRIAGPLSLTAELRCLGVVPEGARVIASVWSGADEVRTSCPADPYVDLRTHLRGARLGMPPEGAVVLRPLTVEARAALERVLPWVAEPLREAAPRGVIEADDGRPSVEELARALDLDPDTAEWLDDLLHEE